MSSDGTQDNPHVIVVSPKARGLLAAITAMQDAESRKPTLEEEIARTYGISAEQAAKLAVEVRKVISVMGKTAHDIVQAMRPAMESLAEFAKQFDPPPKKQHLYERPKLPSQQGYNRTPYDRWRNSLGGGKGRKR